MQGLADGYFVIPYTIGSYLSREIATKAISTDHEAFVDAEQKVQAQLERLLSIKGSRSVDHFHKRLGKIMWDKCGMARNEAGLKQAIGEISALREEFWKDVRVPGGLNELNPELEKAARVADFLELGELMCHDALNRAESCGGHFREEHQTEEGEAQRHDEQFMYVSAWEYAEGNKWTMHKEDLVYEVVKPSQRSYK